MKGKNTKTQTQADIDAVNKQAEELKKQRNATHEFVRNPRGRKLNLKGLFRK